MLYAGNYQVKVSNLGFALSPMGAGCARLCLRVQPRAGSGPEAEMPNGILFVSFLMLSSRSCRYVLPVG